MKVKQVFHAYNSCKVNSIELIYHFCPMCGKQLSGKSISQRQICSECNWTHYLNPSPGVVVLVIKDDDILLGKRDKNSFSAGKWCLPGGFIEFEEDFLSASIREVKEETGLNIEILSILNVVSNFLSTKLHTLVIVLEGKAIGGELLAGDDIVELKWFSFLDALPAMAFDADKHIIERYGEYRFEGIPIDPEYSKISNPLG